MFKYQVSIGLSPYWQMRFSCECWNLDKIYLVKISSLINILQHSSHGYASPFLFWFLDIQAPSLHANLSPTPTTTITPYRGLVYSAVLKYVRKECVPKLLVHCHIKSWWQNGHRSCLPCWRLGSIPRRIETLGSVSVNHSLTRLRCKNDMSECWEDLMCPHCGIV